MAIEPDARKTVGHLHAAALLHRRMAGIVLTEEQQLQLRQHRLGVEQAAQARGEKRP